VTRPRPRIRARAQSQASRAAVPVEGTPGGLVNGYRRSEHHAQGPEGELDVWSLTEPPPQGTCSGGGSTALDVVVEITRLA
jgi:hypothetical protein